MAAAAEVLGDVGDVEFAFAADAETELVGGGDFSEEDCGFDAGDADEIVDDSFAILGVGSYPVHVFPGDPGPGDGAIALEVRKGYAEEADFAGGIGEVEIVGDLSWVRSPGG